AAKERDHTSQRDPSRWPDKLSDRALMAKLADQLVRLATLSPAELRAEWRRWHRGQIMPPGLGRDLASRAIAWYLQERVQGGYLPASERELKRLTKQMRET